jgi:hypothetical protein
MIGAFLSVIPGRAEGANPESITTDRGYGVRLSRYALGRNDGEGMLR